MSCGEDFANAACTFFDEISEETAGGAVLVNICSRLARPLVLETDEIELILVLHIGRMPDYMRKFNAEQLEATRVSPARTPIRGCG